MVDGDTPRQGPLPLTRVSQTVIGSCMLSGKHGRPMTVEQHPLYPAWSTALGHMVEAERRYYKAVMARKPDEEIQLAACDLDDAREKYRAIADQIG